MIIPVELISFTANIFENSVTISWTTATETNNMGFELERKLDESWEKLVFIEGRGSSTEESNYQYNDDFKYQSFKGVIYRLKQIDFSGIYEYSDFIEIDVDFTPKEFVLYQNYPNPFNPTTIIKYQVPELSYVTIKVYDVLGNEVTILVNKRMEAGRYEVTLDASSLASGVYIYRMQVNSYLESKMMVLLK
jgi:hypothetical protein